jgi:hypothetical protein
MPCDLASIEIDFDPPDDCRERQRSPGHDEVGRVTLRLLHVGASVYEVARLPKVASPTSGSRHLRTAPTAPELGRYA